MEKFIFLYCTVISSNLIGQKVKLTGTCVVDALHKQKKQKHVIDDYAEGFFFCFKNTHTHTTFNV